MKLFKILFVLPVMVLFFSSAAAAGDFDWMSDMNIRAEADPSVFRAMLGTRLKIGEVEVEAILSNFENHADASMALRLGEMCGRPTAYVIEQYKSNKENGWGVLAKGLGIKPGSEQFHALKNGHDLYNENESGPSKEQGKSKGKKNK